MVDRHVTKVTPAILNRRVSGHANDDPTLRCPVLNVPRVTARSRRATDQVALTIGSDPCGFRLCGRWDSNPQWAKPTRS
jgi:hypothetical protein